MPKFAVGDHVERISAFAPIYMKSGIIVHIIPNEDNPDWLTEYEVNFGDQIVEFFYQTELRLVQTAETAP